MYESVSHEKILSDKELCKLVLWTHQNDEDPAWQRKIAAVRTVLATGVRRGELVNLRIPEDCLYEGIIIIRRGKTKSSKRTIPIAPEFLGYYQEWWRLVMYGTTDPHSVSQSWRPEGSNFLIPRKRIVNGFVWVEPYSIQNASRYRRKDQTEGYWRKASPDDIWRAKKPLSPTLISYWWQDVMIAAGIVRKKDPDIKNKHGILSIHKGRHTKISWELASRRLSELEAQKLAGHKSLEITQGMYSHMVLETMYKDDKEPEWRKLVRKCWNKKQAAKKEAEEEGDVRKEIPPLKPSTDDRKRIRMTVPENMAYEIDKLVAEKGYANRQELVNELFRELLLKEEMEKEYATLSIVE